MVNLGLYVITINILQFFDSYKQIINRLIN